MRFLISLAALLLLIPLSARADEAIRYYFEALDSGYRMPVHGDYLLNNDALQRFYQARNFQPVWYQDGETTNAARDMYLAVETATVDGLQPEDYHNRALQTHCPAEQFDRLAYCDMLFTDAFLVLAQHLLEGKVHPGTLAVDWQLERRRQGLVPLLETALAEDSVKSTLANLRPQRLGYERLMAALRRLRVATRYPEWGALPLSPAIEPGEKDERLSAIVDRLVFWGDMPKPEKQFATYGEDLQQAIVWFKRRHGLAGTPVIDKATLEALNVGPTQRAQQIFANLERMRWLAEDLGPKHLLVNIAEPMVEAVEHNQTAFIKPLDVSLHYRQVPAFSDRIRYMVLNPGWTVARRLAVKELLPAAQQDPDFLSRLGFTVFDGTAPVAPGTVDWSTVSVDNFPYRLVQSPGPRNALGNIKFMLPNKHQVILHGTPEEDLLVRDQGFGAGSMRVGDPLELAAWVLGDNPAAAARIEEAVATGTPTPIHLRKPLPVHVTYRTAWVNSQGALNFRKDIYDRDEPLYEALIARLPAVAADDEGN